MQSVSRNPFLTRNPGPAPGRRAAEDEEAGLSRDRVFRVARSSVTSLFATPCCLSQEGLVVRAEA
jgi:hypothetical protein